MIGDVMFSISYVLFSPGLCYGGSLLPDLWSLLRGLGPDCGLRQFIALLGSPDGSAAPEFHVVSMFCDCMANYVV